MGSGLVAMGDLFFLGYWPIAKLPLLVSKSFFAVVVALVLIEVLNSSLDTGDFKVLGFSWNESNLNGG